MILMMLLLLLQGNAPRTVVLSGTVIDANASIRQPLFHARVQIGDGIDPAFVTRTSEDGAFSFSNLQPGTYALTITNEGFLKKIVNVRVTAAESRRDVTIGLDHAPTISGRVSDPRNAPIANILVEMIKEVYGPRGNRTLMTLESALTDDRGEYHLYWIDPGEYYIRATSLPQKPNLALPGNEPLDPGRPIYAPTYYPAFRDPKDAAKIRVRVGMNQGPLDIKLQNPSEVAIGGHVSTYEGIGNSGVPADLLVSPAGAVASIQKYTGRAAPLDAKAPARPGDFTVRGLLPGTYVFHAQYLRNGEQLFVNRKVTVRITDLSFTFKISAGVSIRGQIVSESGEPIDFRPLRVSFDVTDPDLPSPASSNVNAVGEFQVNRAEPGEYSLRVDGLPGDFYLKSSKAGAVDVQSRPMRVDYDAPPPVRVVVASDGGRLDGGVFDARDRAMPATTVVLVPDAARRTSPDQFRVGTTLDDGSYSIRGIPPGEYKLFAWPKYEPNAYLDPNYLQLYERYGQPVVIPSRGVVTASVRAIPED